MEENTDDDEEYTEETYSEIEGDIEGPDPEEADNMEHPEPEVEEAEPETEVTEPSSSVHISSSPHNDNEEDDKDDDDDDDKGYWWDVFGVFED